MRANSVLIIYLQVTFVNGPGACTQLETMPMPWLECHVNNDTSGNMERYCPYRVELFFMN